MIAEEGGFFMSAVEEIMSQRQINQNSVTKELWEEYWKEICKIR